jgi:hypothetical protein
MAIFVGRTKHPIVATAPYMLFKLPTLVLINFQNFSLVFNSLFQYFYNLPPYLSFHRFGGMGTKDCIGSIDLVTVDQVNN